MIGVAFEAARFSVVRALRVTLLANRDTRNQNVRRFRAPRRILVAALARKCRVRIVIKPRVRQPLQPGAGRGDYWQF